jgi:hypothetical protein
MQIGHDKYRWSIKLSCNPNYDDVLILSKCFENANWIELAQDLRIVTKWLALFFSIVFVQIRN